MTNDLFAQRMAVVRERFAAKLPSRIAEIEAALPKLDQAADIDMLEQTHRHTHDLCGVGPTMGFVATGTAARAIEQLLLGALRDRRKLSGDEVERLHTGIAALREAARRDIAAIAPE